jgi:thioredoxin 2
MKVITESQFENDYNNKTVVALFTAKGCFPCGLMKNAVNYVENKLIQKDVLEFVDLDTDANSLLSEELNINATPTMIIFHEGKELHRHEGSITTKQIKREIAETLSKHNLIKIE